MKTTAIETVNGAEISKMVIRTSIPQTFSGLKMGRRSFSRTVYFVCRGGRVVPCQTLAAARAEAAK